MRTGRLARPRQWAGRGDETVVDAGREDGVACAGPDGRSTPI
jgi:hypothetical protein